MNQIEFKNLTIEFWQLTLQFIIDIAKLTNLEKSDILEFIGLNSERNQNKLKHKIIAESYAFLSDQDKESLKLDDKLKDLDFNKIDELAIKHIEKIARIENFESNFIEFFTSIKRTDAIYVQAIDLLSFVTGIDKDILDKEPFAYICDLLIKVGYAIEEEVGKGFFIMKPVQTALKNTSFISFIKIVKETMQSYLLKV